MDFFGIGGGEVILILVVALIIWGPARITEIGRTLGKVAHTMRKATSDLTAQITKEIEEQEKEKEKEPPPQHHEGGRPLGG